MDETLEALDFCIKAQSWKCLAQTEVYTADFSGTDVFYLYCKDLVVVVLTQKRIFSKVLQKHCVQTTKLLKIPYVSVIISLQTVIHILTGP